jgi:hypothetical protein
MPVLRLPGWSLSLTELVDSVNAAHTDAAASSGIHDERRSHLVRRVVNSREISRSKACASGEYRNASCPRSLSSIS